MRSGFNMKWLAVSLALAGGTMANVADAAIVNCPGTEVTGNPLTWGNWTDREFALDTSTKSTCTATGDGTFNDASYVANGWQKITTGGSLSVTGLGGDDGTFGIGKPVWDAYSSVLFVLQGGGGGVWDLGLIGASPDWAAFTLASNTSGGKWGVSTNSISRITIYGTTASVPEPATLALFGAGLLGLAFMRRRQTA